MLKELFTSNVRVKILGLFLSNPNSKFYIRELTRLLDEQINSIRRELENLKHIGILKAKLKLRKKYYVLNSDFPAIKELSMLFLKLNDKIFELSSKLTKLGEIDFLLFTGQFLRKECDVDLLIVGTVNKLDLQNLLETQDIKPIKYSLLSIEDFKYRLKVKDSFIKNILNDEDAMILINKLN